MTTRSTSLLPRLGVIAAIAMVAALTAPAAHAQTLLTYFNHNDEHITTFPDLVSDAPGLQTTTITTDFSPSIGITSIFPGTTLNAVGAAPAGYGIAVNSGGGTFIQFNFSTVGFEDLSLSYATLMTTGGFTTQTLSYSTNGVTFTDFGSFSPTGTWSVASFDLSSISALDNAASVTLRLTFSGASGSGANYIDNIQVNAAVPEPATVLGGLLGVAGLCFHQRRRLLGMLKLA